MRNLTLLILAAAVASGCEAGNELLVLDGQLSLRIERPGLLEQVSVPPERARDLALDANPGGTIVEVELEEEGGLLIYTFDISLADEAVIEVEVDAMTGRVGGRDAGGESDEDVEDEGADDADDREREP